MRLPEISTSAFSIRPLNSGRRSEARSTSVEHKLRGLADADVFQSDGETRQELRARGADVHRVPEPRRRLCLQRLAEPIAREKPVRRASHHDDQHDRRRQRYENKASQHGMSLYNSRRPWTVPRFSCRRPGSAPP